jgi:protein TonB
MLGTDRALPSGQDRELRLLEYAIAASIVLHVIALAGLQWVTPRSQSSAATPTAISARLVELAAPALPAPSAPAPAAPVPEQKDTGPTPTSIARMEIAASPPQPTLSARPEPGRAPAPEPEAAQTREAKSASTPGPKPAARREPKAQAKPKPRAESLPRSAAEAAPAPDVAKPSPALREPQPVAPQSGALARAAPPPLPASSALSAPSVDADALARYRLQLIGAARRYKRYPRAAMDNQWEGSAEVALVIGTNGRIREMTISSSSGHAVLDQQAIDMFRKAKPLVPIPAALRGREFRVTLKAIYSLREPGA